MNSSSRSRQATKAAQIAPASSSQPQHRRAQDQQKREVERAEACKIPFSVHRTVAQEGAERDQTGKGRDDGPAAADVHADQQIGIILRELGEQDRARNVADALAGQHAHKQRVLFQKRSKKAPHGADAPHVSGKDKERGKGAEQRIIDPQKGAPVQKPQSERDHDQSCPVRDQAEHDHNGVDKERQIRRGARPGQAGHLTTQRQRLCRNEKNAAGGDHGDGEKKRRQHDGHKLPRRDREAAVQKQVLGIAERRQHPAEIRRDILHDKGKRHFLLVLCCVQNIVAERQKGQQRHIVGDQHRAEERDDDQREHRGAQSRKAAHDIPRQRVKKADVAERVDDGKRTEQACQRAEIKIAEIRPVRRDQKRGRQSGAQRNDKHKIFANKFRKPFEKKHTCCLADVWISCFDSLTV